MCEACRVPDVPVTLTVVNPELQPKKAARLKARGGRYVFGEDLLDPNVKDALSAKPATTTWSVPAEAWERIFGKKET